MIGEHDKDIALVFAYHEDVSPRWDLLNPEVLAKQYQDNLNFIGRGIWKAKVTPYRIAVPKDFRIHYSVMDWDYFWERIGNHKYLHVQGGSGGAEISGMADYDGPHIWTAHGSEWNRMHEGGHAFGMLHNRRNGNEYGGHSWMGKGWGYCAPDMMRLGLIDAEWGEGEYLLNFPESRGPYTKMIVVEVYGSRFGIAYERGRGKPAVYVMEPADRAGVNDRAVLQPGESYTIVGQVTVKYLGNEDGLARVRIGRGGSIDEGGWRIFPNLKFDEKLQGLWISDFTHQGFHLFVRGNEAIIYWYTFDSKGNPRWLWGKGPIKGDVAYLALYTTHDREVRNAGKAVMAFQNPEKGEFEYVLDNLDHWMQGRDLIKLRLLAGNGENGLFEFTNRESEGISVFKKGDTHIWHYGYNGFDQDWEYIHNGKVYQAVGGKFNCVTDSTLQRTGKAELTDNEFRMDGEAFPL